MAKTGITEAQISIPGPIAQTSAPPPVPANQISMHPLGPRIVSPSIEIDPTRGRSFVVVNIVGTVLYTEDGCTLQLVRAIPVRGPREAAARATLWRLVGSKRVTANGDWSGPQPWPAEITLPDGTNLTAVAGAYHALTSIPVATDQPLPISEPEDDVASALTGVRILPGSSSVDTVGFGHFPGEVVNGSTATFNSVGLEGVFYDRSGRVVFTGTETVRGPISPGGRGGFSFMLMRDVAPLVARWTVRAVK
jgi:hypothetical protein